MEVAFDQKRKGGGTVVLTRDGTRRRADTYSAGAEPDLLGTSNVPRLLRPVRA
jgi:hypothetical protein